MQNTSHPATADIRDYAQRIFAGRPSGADLFEAVAEACAEPMARYGIHEVTFTRIARGMHWGRGAIANRFNTPQSIAAVIVVQHLSQLSTCMDMIPADTPTRAVLIRAIYRKAVRREDGTFNAAHRLLLRDEWQFSPKARAKIAECRAAITAQLAPPHQAALALALLDTETMPHDQLEATLAATEAAPALTGTTPEPAAEIPAAPQIQPITPTIIPAHAAEPHESPEAAPPTRLHPHGQTPNLPPLPYRLAA